MKKKGSKNRRLPQTYSDEFKWKVAKEVLSGELSQAEVRRKYNIGSNSALLYWTREFSGIDNPRESRLLFMLENKTNKKDKLSSDQKKDIRVGISSKKGEK